MHSEHVNGDLTIQIAFPKGYDDSTTEYQSIYLLDGNYFFNETCGLEYLIEPEEGMAKIVQRLIDQEKIPPSILIGIGYTETQRTSYTGINSLNFHHFFTEELIPEIESRYKVSKSADDRILFGYSGSAHFSTYALLYETYNANKTFDKFISISGAYDLLTPIIDLEEDLYNDFGNDRFTNQSLFIGIGQNDPKTSLVNAHTEFTEKFLGRNHINLRLTNIVFEGKGHYDIPEFAFQEAMIWLFAEI
jgi:predicted alpha/beta superfamily hydrolase